MSRNDDRRMAAHSKVCKVASGNKRGFPARVTKDGVNKFVCTGKNFAFLSVLSQYHPSRHEDSIQAGVSFGKAGRARLGVYPCLENISVAHLHVS